MDIKTKKESIKIKDSKEDLIKKENTEKECSACEETEEKTPQEVIERQEKQTKWVLVFMAVFIAGIFISAWVVSESKKYDYEGLEWKKEMFGKIPIYTASLTGYSTSGMPLDTTVVLRNDPRELEKKIPIEGEVKVLGGPVYFSMDLKSDLSNCGTLSLVSFGTFMSGMGFKVITAVNSEDESKKYGRPFVDCTNEKQNTVYMFVSGNESKISQYKENPNCYIISVNNCEDVETLERLEVAILSTFNKS